MENRWPVILRQGINRYGRRICYVLNYSEDERTIRCPWDKVTDLLTGEVFSMGDEISLGDWNLRILEEKPVSEEKLHKGARIPEGEKE